MTRSNPKKNISRENLNNHNIFYDADVFRPPCTLPSHVDAVREILLSFDNIVPGGKGWRKTFKDENLKHNPRNFNPESARPPDTSFVPVAAYERDSNERSPQWRTAHDKMKSCVEVAEVARKLEADMEDGWTNFWRQSTFTVVSETTKQQPGFHPVLDKWSIEGNCTWTEFDNLEPCDPSLKPRTLPKPDLAYAFPMVNRMFENLKGAERDDFSRCFSLEAFQMLTAKGTLSTMTSGLRNSTQSADELELSTADRACFPWAIVEVKKQVSVRRRAPVVRCYCQAANGAAAALALRARLFDRVVHDAYATLPPVIAFTCCGPDVKVWLMYYMEPDANGKRARRMVCIWSTSVLLTWGVASLRAIIINMHTWASRILKPRIQACIYEILQQPGQGFFNMAVSPFREVPVAGHFQSPRSENSDSRSSCRSDDSFTLLNVDESPCRGKRMEAVADAHPTVIISRLASSYSRNSMTAKEAPSDPNLGWSQNMCQKGTPQKASKAGLFGSADRRAVRNQLVGQFTATKKRDNHDEVAQITESLKSSHLEDQSARKQLPNRFGTAQVGLFEKGAAIKKPRNSTGSFGQNISLSRSTVEFGGFGAATITPKIKGGLFGNPSKTPKTTGRVLDHPSNAPKTTGNRFGSPSKTPKTTGRLFGHPSSAPKATGRFFSMVDDVQDTDGSETEDSDMEERFRYEYIAPEMRDFIVRG